MRHLSLTERRPIRRGPAAHRSQLAGVRSGRLLALEPVGIDLHQSILWLCVCECGQTTRVRAAYIRSGKVKSCGCLRVEVSRARATGNTFARMPRLSTRGDNHWTRRRAMGAA